MENGEYPNGELPEEIDLSKLSLEEWIGRVFEAEREQHESPFDDGITMFPAYPERLVCLIADTCRAMPDLAARLNPVQMERGIWFLFGAEADLTRALMDQTIPLVTRLDAISAIRDVYVELVARGKLQTDGTSLFMWWDVICCGFWTAVRQRLEDSRAVLPTRPEPEAMPHPSPEAYRRFMAKSAAWKWGLVTHLDADERAVHEALAASLSAMLSTTDEHTQDCAAHGFNHLYHPAGRELLHALHVRRLATLQPGDEEAQEWLDWLARCAKGEEM